MQSSQKSQKKRNKKVVNATKITFEGIDFKSKTELRVYQKLYSLGYHPLYEPDTFIIWKGSFRPSKVWYIDGEPQVTKKNKTLLVGDWHYTPDFKISKDNKIIYIEVKGKPNDVYPYKRKLFLKYIDSLPNVYFAEIHSVKGLVDFLSKI